MAKHFQVNTDNQVAAVDRMIASLGEFVRDPAFVPAYFDDPTSRLKSEHERPFGFVSLESLGLYYTCLGYDALVREDQAAELLLAKGLAHYSLAFKLEAADIAYQAKHKKDYFPIGTTTCLLGFARSVSYGQVSEAISWSRLLSRLSELNLKYLLDSVTDPALAHHLLLIGRVWSSGAWPNASDVGDELGVYRSLWLKSADQQGFDRALNDCAVYHLQEAFGAGMSEFGALPYGPYPVELTAWIRTYRRVHKADLPFPNHPLFLTPIVLHGDLPSFEDPELARISEAAKNFYGDCWV